jgi:DNA-binding transcriptional MerR regulator
MKDKQTYTTRAICRNFNISERQLIHWAERGLVSPLVDAEGIGTRRKYTAKNVLEIGVISTLWGSVTVTTIKKALEWISVYKDKPEEVEYMILTEEEVYPVRRGHAHRITNRVVKDIGFAKQLALDEYVGPDPVILGDIISKNDLVIVLNMKMVREKAEDLLIT